MNERWNVYFQEESGNHVIELMEVASLLLMQLRFDEAIPLLMECEYAYSEHRRKYRQNLYKMNINFQDIIEFHRSNLHFPRVGPIFASVK